MALSLSTAFLLLLQPGVCRHQDDDDYEGAPGDACGIHLIGHCPAHHQGHVDNHRHDEPDATRAGDGLRPASVGDFRGGDRPALPGDGARLGRGAAVHHLCAGADVDFTASTRSAIPLQTALPARLAGRTSASAGAVSIKPAILSASACLHPPTHAHRLALLQRLLN